MKSVIKNDFQVCHKCGLGGWVMIGVKTGSPTMQGPNPIIFTLPTHFLIRDRAPF